MVLSTLITLQEALNHGLLFGQDLHFDVVVLDLVVLQQSLDFLVSHNQVLALEVIADQEEFDGGPSTTRVFLDEDFQFLDVAHFLSDQTFYLFLHYKQ